MPYRLIVETKNSTYTFLVKPGEGTTVTGGYFGENVYVVNLLAEPELGAIMHLDVPSRDKPYITTSRVKRITREVL